MRETSVPQAPRDPFATDHVYWLSQGSSESWPPLRSSVAADVAIVGAGFTGLWSAIQLLETDPALRVVVLEQGSVAFGASGRNGGFCAASLTHGLANGLRHFPDEVDILEREGRRNLQELVGFVRARGIDCDLEETGALSVATEPWQSALLEEEVELATRHGDEPALLDRAAIQEALHSPTYLAGIRYPASHTVMVDPAALCRGLARVATEMGATIHERTQVKSISATDQAARLITVAPDGTQGSVIADRVIAATSAYVGWYPPLRRVAVPVYDYVLVSEPLTTDQRQAIGWHGREGASDSGNRFHYFRLTADDRILWGGFDAIYHYGSRVDPELDLRPASFATLEANFRTMFPQLSDLAFPYRWGGAIDTSARFHVTFGRGLKDRLVYVVGYTGLGVGASRWAAGVARDMILRPDSELLRLRFVRRRPFPWPPEPVRSLGIRWVQRDLARADETGRRSVALRLLDALGIGFDS
jgi:glycine/D-amino acid oxidase-like deaminating enzyme